MTDERSILDEHIRIDGAVSVVETPDAVIPHRVDRRFAHELPVETTFVEGMPSGVRLVFGTDADSVTIRCTPMRLSFGIEPLPAVFDLVVDGVLIDSVEAAFGHTVVIDPASGDTDFVAGEAGQITLEGIPNQSSTVEVWLPQSAGVEIHAASLPGGHSFRSAPVDDRPRWVHHGSSISHCMEADSPWRTWPAVAAARSGLHLINLGFAGQCHIDQFSARTIRDLEADRISLKLGINIINGDSMTARTFGPAVHGFLDTIREGHPETPIMVISPIICPVVEHLPGPTTLGEDGKVETHGRASDLAIGRLSLTRVRSELEEIVAVRRAAGDQHLHHLDGRELFGEADLGNLPDGLHPNTEGYRQMGERFADHPFLSEA